MRRWLVIAAFVATIATTRGAQAGEHLTVLVPDKDNLQYMSFWVAQAGGHFTRAGIDVELVIAPSPQQTESMFESNRAEAAVLAPPMYLRFIAAKLPFVIVANLLRNDPIDLIVRRDVLEARKLSTSMPVKERLVGLRGVRLGVAPHPPSRLRALYASQGLDADKDLELVILGGKVQNAAFTEKKVDALYAHTPFLEKAIVHDDAVVLVDQNRGEIAAVTNPQIHCLAFRRSVGAARPGLMLAALRAIGEAEKSIHASQRETVEVLARAFPERDRRELEVIVRLYEPAIPDSPEVHVEGLLPALALFPDGLPKPDLTGIDLASYVATDLAPKTRTGELAPPADDSARARMITIGVGIAAFMALLIGMLTARRKHSPAE